MSKCVGGPIIESEVYHLRGVQILLQKVFERGFIHVMAYAENPNFTGYSINEFYTSKLSSRFCTIL